MIEVTPTPEEAGRECFADKSLDRSMTAIREDGFVVINDVVDHAHLDKLRGKMEADLQLVRALPVVPHNFVWGNIQQDPPHTQDLCFVTSWRTRSSARSLVRFLAPARSATI
jgi:hypothetical protein